MIVIVGDYRESGAVAGLAATTAHLAVASGAAVQAVGILPADEGGDRRLVELASDGIGHAAMLRSSGTEMEPADLELALRYLPDARVVVLVDVPGRIVPTGASGAEWAGAHLLVVTAPGAVLDAAGLPEAAIVVEAPERDVDATFAGFLADVVVRLAAGTDPKKAWNAAVRAKAVDALSRPGR